MGTDPSAGLDSAREDVTYCARHPQVESSLACGRCGTLICPRCLVQTPVGARCPDCAGIPRFVALGALSPAYLARSVGAAIVAGSLTGVAWSWITRGTYFGFLTFLLGLGIGWAVSEAIGLASNRRRGPALQACAVLAIVIAYLARNVALGVDLLPAGDLSGYLTAGIAAFFAASRLRGY